LRFREPLLSPPARSSSKPAPRTWRPSARPGSRQGATSEEEVQRDAAADKKRDELIDELKTIIPKIPESEKKADLYFPAGGAVVEKARYVSLQEVKDYDDAIANGRRRAPARSRGYRPS